MEAVKLSRHRISDIDCDGYRPMKRRLNGTCHLEGGGNWHINLLPEKNSSANTDSTSTNAIAATAVYLADVKPQAVDSSTPQLTPKQHLVFNRHHQLHNVNGVEGQVQTLSPAHHQSTNPAPLPVDATVSPPLMEPARPHVPPIAHPVLPPSLRESLNGMCHLEGGGNWHISLLTEKASSATTNPASAKAIAASAAYLTDVKPQAVDSSAPQLTPKQQLVFNHHQQLHNVNGTEDKVHPLSSPYHQTTNPTGGGGGLPVPLPVDATAHPPLLEPAQPHLSPAAHPVLPPSLRESERMQSVERWINSIPLDAPIHVQTSLTQIVPISDSKAFPDELSVSDHLSSAPNNSVVGAVGDNFRGGGLNYDYYSQQSQVGGYGSGGGGGGVTSRCNTTTASTSAPHPHHPNGGVGYHPRAYHSGGGGGDQPSLHPPPIPPRPGPADNQGIRARSFTRGPPNRFFNNYETQFVVKLFRDFFANGSCPSLNEVRRRMAHSQLQGRRNANSVRAKVKRLQVSGRWKDYEIL